MHLINFGKQLIVNFKASQSTSVFLAMYTSVQQVLATYHMKCLHTDREHGNTNIGGAYITSDSRPS